MTDFSRLWIHLYDEKTAPALRAEEVAAFLEEVSGWPADLRGEFLSHHRPAGALELAQALAAAKVRHPDRCQQAPPVPGEVDFERRRLEAGNRGSPGVAYDGFALVELISGLLPPAERSLRHLHLLLTNRLPATWDRDDLRYHLRAAVFGPVSLISTSGLVEAPAKPREFYLELRAQGPVRSPERYSALKRRYRGLFLDYDDPRLTEVVKGYALQALFHRMVGDPFCPDPGCRLFNAHWQQEMLRAQLEGELCPEHRRVVRPQPGRPPGAAGRD